VSSSLSEEKREGKKKSSEKPWDDHEGRRGRKDISGKVYKLVGSSLRKRRPKQFQEKRAGSVRWAKDF